MVATLEAGPASEQTSAARSRLGALLAIARTSRVVHFAVLGGLLFAVARDPDASRVIRVQTHGAGLDGAERRQIEDEVLVREAARLGLDRDDPIVRRRLVQKVLFLAEDLGGASRSPDDAALRGFFAAHAERYAVPARARFTHVFARTRDEAAALRPQAIAWSAAHAGDAPPPLGDAFPISRSVSRAIADVGDELGPDVQRVVTTTAPATWSEPVRSKYGWHLVRVIARTAARPARFEEVRSRVALDYLIDKREDAVAAFMDKALPRYDIEVDGKRVRHLEPTRRAASPAQASAED